MLPAISAKCTSLSRIYVRILPSKIEESRKLLRFLVGAVSQDQRGSGATQRQPEHA